MTNGSSGTEFLNRELGQIAFNRRVLAQAENNAIPLLERLKFLCIVSSNFDEFFEIRVAGLKEQMKLDTPGFGPDGMVPHQVFKLVSKQTHELVARQYQLLNQEILPGLANEDIHFLRRSTWNDVQREWIKAYFFRELMPVLTPIGLDISHPFPRVLNKSLNFAVELEGKDAFGRSSGTAIVQAPRVLPRVIQLPAEISSSEYNFVFLSSILHAHVGELFSGMSVLGCYQFRATRNSDLFVDEEEVKNLRIALQGELPQRHLGNAVRLEVADNCPQHMSDFLLDQLGLSRDDFYQVEGPVNLVRLMQVPDRIARPALKFSPFIPGLPLTLQKKKAGDIFQMIRRNDILLHHPYQSFQPVIHFLQRASTDPDVKTLCKNALFQFRLQNWKTYFYPAKEVTIHPIRAREIYSVCSVAPKVENPAMFKKAPYDGTHPDALRQSSDARAQGTHPTNDQVDLNPCPRGGIKRLDDLRLKQCIHFCDNASGFPLLGALNLAIDRFEYLPVEAERRLPEVF